MSQEENRLAAKALDRLVDWLVDDILNATPEEILAEFQEDHGDVERQITEMRALVEKSVVAANAALGNSNGASQPEEQSNG